MSARLTRPGGAGWRRALAAAGLLAPLCAAAPAAADGPSRVEAIEGRDQHALVVELTPDAVRARACRTLSACQPGGESIPIDAEARADHARLELISLAGGRSAVLVSAPAKQGPGRWVLLLAASGKPHAPEVRKLLVGHLEAPRGVEGGERTPVLLREPADGGERLVQGWRHESATLCGRPTLLQARVLDPASLEWLPTNARSLDAGERRQATALTAEPTGEPFGVDEPRLLHAFVASSAEGRDRSGLTDRRLDTRWAESRPGDGEGEFIVMSASDAVPITAFELVVVPSGAEAGAAVPKTVYLATRREVFSVALPAEPRAGAAYRVSLPRPLETDCVGLVLGPRASRGSEASVGLAELRAVTPLEGSSPEQLALALDDDSAVAARALLERGGEAATRAVMDVYGRLGPEGKRRALDVVDGGECALTSPFWVDRLLGVGVTGPFDPDEDPVARRARDRLRLCRAEAGAALAARLRGAPGARRAWAARELAGIAPAEAVTAIVDLLDERDAEVRRGLRSALSVAVESRRAQPAIRAELEPGRFAARPLVARIDLLRSLGPQLPRYPGAAAALAQVSHSDASFRTRYLLLGPAAHLAKKGEPGSLELLERALTSDESRHVRAEAARRAAGIGRLAKAVERALDDRQPRVRQAALEALQDSGEHVGPKAEQRMLELLARDPWTFVRVEAAGALAGRPRTPASDRALMDSLEQDESAAVRAAVLRALGARKSHIAAQVIHDVANQPRESQSVRIAAIKALGDLCRKDAAPLLYKLALRAGNPQLPYDQALGLAALAALGEIKPPDLMKGLAPLLGSDPRVVPLVRRIAREVVRREGSCGPKKKRTRI